MRDPIPDRNVVEALWYQRLKDAHLRFNFASNYACQLQRDWKSGELPSPDGNYAYQQALHAQNLALVEYRRVLRIITDLVVKGKVPDESDAA